MRRLGWTGLQTEASRFRYLLPWTADIWLDPRDEPHSELPSSLLAWTL